jgi:ribosomal protein S18 acetylase RimI-like enzyme
VAEADGRIAGCVVATWDGWRGNLYRLAVDPGRRRQGIAADLLRASEARLAALGARRISALVTAGDPAAEGVWRSAGYRPDERVGRFVKLLKG